MWDPRQYARYRDERARPFFELLQRVPERVYGTVADLGCGAGELTRVLADRWPSAKVTGVDNSAEMLAKAERLAGRLDFVERDLMAWTAKTDLVVSNATLQWVPDHERVVAHLAGLAPVLAVQMPSNFEEPSHVLMAETAREGPWVAKLSKGWRPNSVKPLGWYVEELWRLGFDVDAWETVYHHVLPGDDPVLEWTKGTALRPVLALLEPGERAGFLEAYAATLRKAYPKTPNGTRFPFRRIFFVGVRR
jgi:trans-aconitate 2-methyltransferase